MSDSDFQTRPYGVSFLGGIHMGVVQKSYLAIVGVCCMDPQNPGIQVACLTEACTGVLMSWARTNNSLTIDGEVDHLVPIVEKTLSGRPYSALLRKKLADSIQVT